MCTHVCAQTYTTMCAFGSLVPRPLPDCISQRWKKLGSTAARYNLGVAWERSYVSDRGGGPPCASTFWGTVRILSHTSSMVEAVTLGKARENSVKMSKKRQRYCWRGMLFLWSSGCKRLRSGKWPAVSRQKLPPILLRVAWNCVFYGGREQEVRGRGEEMER